jgi:WD40 repeat protein
MRTDNTNPYVGLRPFDVGESILFFGRNVQTLELLQRLHQHHFVAVVGSSGCGKSSLLRAGLIPALKAGYLVDDSDRWIITIMKPGQSPLYNLAETLLQQINASFREADTASLVQRINEEGADAILNLIIPFRIEKKVNFFLLVDQFEELFRFSMDQNDIAKKDEAIDFVNIMLELSRQNIIPFYAVITMRSDFIGDCARFFGLPEAMNESQYLVPRLNRSEMKMAIEGPARLYGSKLNPTLTSKLLNESGKVKDELPLLQHALMRMWEFEMNVNKSGELDIEDYKSIGGIEKALDNHADEALTGLSERELQITKKLFQALTAIDENGRKIRRPVLLSQLKEITGGSEVQLLNIIDLFIKDRRSFLVISNAGGTGDKVIDISHESLIRQWNTLSKWVDEEGEAVAGYMQLAQSATLYRQKKRDFLDGTELEIAMQWFDRFKPEAAWANRYEEGFTDTINYLMKSSDVHAEKEQQRLAGKKQEEERQKREKASRKKQRLLGFGIVLLLILAVGAILLVIRFKNIIDESNKNKGYAQIYKLYSKAEIAVENDPTLALRITELAMNANANIKADESVKKKNDSLLWSFALYIFSENSFYKILLKQDLSVNTASYSPAGDKILYASGRTARLCNLSCDTTFIEFRGHSGEIHSVVFSPDGKKILTGSSDSTVRLWDMYGTSLKTIPVNAKINAVAISPDGNTFLTGSNDSTAAIWNLKGEKLHVFKDHKAEVSSVAFSPDGKSIITASWDRTVRLYDLKWNLIREFKGHSGMIQTAIFSPDGKMILTGSRDNTARLWNVMNGATIEVFDGHLSDVSKVAFSPDGTTILTGSRDRTVRLWDLSGNELQDYKGHTGHVTSVNFSPDGKSFITASDDHTVRLWVLKGKAESKMFGHTGTISSVAFSPTKPKDTIAGKTFLTGSYDSTARLWNQDGEMIKTFNINSKINSVAFSPDGNAILIGSDDHMAGLWNNDKKNLVLFRGHSGRVTSVAFSNDGKYILTGSADSTARLWETNGNLMKVFSGHTGKVLSVCFSPDGKKILTGSDDSTARLWDLNGKHLQKFNGHTDLINSVAFSPTGDMVLTGSNDGTSRLWTINTNNYILFGGHVDDVLCVAFSYDGKSIVSGSRDNTVRLWDLTGNTIQVYKGHISDIMSLSFSRDGNFILSGSRDYTAILWQMITPLKDFLKSDKIETLTAEQKKEFEREIK